MQIVRLLLYILVPFVLVAVPSSYFETGHSICLVRNLIGVDCPGCGMTRALSAMAHGDIVSAFHYNSLVILIGPLLGYSLIRALFAELTTIFGSSSCLVECRKPADSKKR